MSRDFPSLTNDKIAYRVSRAYRDEAAQAFQRAGGIAFVAEWARQFDTYGHGMTQHSPELIRGEWKSLGDPWPCINPKRDEVYEAIQHVLPADYFTEGANK